ncbi:MAG: HD domain-containing protein [Gemmatimonadaceae bacterium]|nr:HD domain-containing protein [Gemmatimonadaceae bacterium]
MALFDLRQASIGDRVEHEFLVRDRIEKTTRAGLPFVVLSLTNRTGTIETAPIWSERLEWAAGAERGRIVHVIGDVGVFGEEGARRRQLQISAPVRVVAVDTFDPTAFLPPLDLDRDRLWDAVDKLRLGIAAPSVRRAVDLFFADDVFRETFERAPASVNGHHAQIGGLLLHVYEVASMARHMARTVRHANADLVVAGALLHDIGKVGAYEVSPKGFAHTPTGVLLGHVTLGALMFDRRLLASGVALTDAQRDEILHFILSHHGALEFGSPVQPMTVEAEIVHWADEASAKATDMLDEFADPELFPPGGSAELSTKRSWRLGRRLWRRPGAWD